MQTMLHYYPTKYFDLVADTETVIYVDFVVTDLVANVKLELDFGLLGRRFCF